MLLKRVVHAVSFLFVVTASAKDVDTISFVNEINLTDFTGQTYLNLMRTEIKPAFDLLATEGYVMCDFESVTEALDLVDTKVKRQALRAAKSLENMERIVNALEGEIVTLNSLPPMIAAVDRSVNRYKLSTFFGLSCGGGVSIRYSENNFGLNVHYDVSESRSGRSFGVGPTRKANDASDKNYLNDIETYLEDSPENSSHFYENLFYVLLDSDPDYYANITEEGQTVLTDFLSVFTAEQARNLMDGRVSPHWDAALLEVTLLGVFHAGQSDFMLYYLDPETGETFFTDETLKQKPCALPSKGKAAQMNDYWQFSRQYENKQHCSRSGINITKKQFRKLGQDLTTYLKEGYPDVYKAAYKSLGLKSSKNLFRSLSYYLISDKLPTTLGREVVGDIVSAWSDVLDVIYQDADDITVRILDQQ